MNPFEFVNSINDKKTHFGEFNQYYEASYKPFLVNRHLSYFPDTVFSAQDMNVNWHLPHKMQYEFLYNEVRPKRRFKKWPPARTTPEDVGIVRDYFGVNPQRAREYLELLTSDQLLEIKERLDRGGDEREKKKNKRK